MGLLIVNADDWGGHREMTDVTLNCFRAGSVTSATAMVYMADSDRAAAIALDAGLPVGLHLNLSQPFDDPSAPAAVRERQAELVPHFRALRLRRFSYDPRLRGPVAGAIRDQLDRFRELYGCEPTHYDGHEHVHLCPDVLFSPALARGSLARAAVRPGGPPTQRLRQALLVRRFTTPDYMIPIDVLYENGEARVPERLALARSASVEVMVHPSWDDDRRRLESPLWRDALSGLRLGSFADLA